MTGYIKPKRVFGYLAIMLILSMCLADSSYSQLRRRYHGIDLDFPRKRCSMEIRGADVADVLRTFADQYNLNFVLSSDVSGKIDLILNKVPVDQAFLTILRTAKLAYIKEGKIYRIMSLEKMAEENKLREESIQMETRIFKPNYASATRLAGSMRNILSKRDGAFVDADQRTNIIVVKDISQKLDEMEALYHLLDVEKVTAVRPIKTEVIKLKFVDTDEMGKNIKSMQSEAGRVEINTKTNSLIISDLPENLAQIRTLIEDIDKPSRQVLIEARIVETTKNFSKALGIQWGGRYTGGPPSGKLFPKATITGVAGIGAATENFAVNLPIVGGSSYGGIGISLGHLKDKVLLDIQLNAMEDKGEGRVLSTPRIATLDNTKAIVEIGERIPYIARDLGEKDIETYIIEYTDAFTKLEVIPHITADDRIKMKIIADKDSADFSDQKRVQGYPTISRKGAETELIVKDGETAVIGGLSITGTTENQSSVPWFADLPLIGVLFKTEYREKNYDELLIFITPHIIEN